MTKTKLRFAGLTLFSRKRKVKQTQSVEAKKESYHQARYIYS